ncbi:MAG: MATE family efflux transporter [Gemmatimonadaceae bacterium]|nr:MATE family efflux transporter [Gemmatimonadaceae bacterium]
MKDLTSGSIPNHIVRLAIPMAAGMIFQTLYYLVDLYFVARLGDAAVAGVSAAGNVQFIVMALTQVLGVGTMALIAHAVGRRDQDDANLVFNQSTLMAAVCGVSVLIGGLLFCRRYMLAVGADAATVEAGTQYLRAFVPGLALQFALISMGSALRGTGIVKPTMLVQIVTVVMNIVLAPVLIAGWGTGRPLGPAGAGLASSLAIGTGVVMMTTYFLRLEHYVGFKSHLLRFRGDVMRRVLKIGVPPGGEFALMFMYTAVVYYVIRDFGAPAQAGYGIGSRVMQAIFMPVMAVAFSAAPLAGQNVGAGRMDRVRDTFRWAAIIGCVPMAVLTLLCQIRPEWPIGIFTKEAAVVAVGAEFLRVISWNFVATGLIFTASGMFQALGNTIPSLISSFSRMLTFALPALWMSTRAGFGLRQVWLLSVATVSVQAVLSILMLLRELRKRGAPRPVLSTA